MKQILFLICSLFLITTTVFADEQQLTQDCDQVERVLLSVPGAKYSRDWGVFESTDGENEYGGCVMLLTGNRSGSPDFQTRLSQLYPSEDTEFGKTGWVIDDSEDSGNDKQNFTILRSGNFCQVSGDWAPGDSTNAKAAPSSSFEIRVECGVKNE